MDKWYISINSKARGPYSDGQIREKIQKGDLLPDTLIYKEGDLDWLPLSQQSLWSPMLKEDEGHSFVPSKNSKIWVLLVENPLKKGDFQQQGPFRQSEVIEKFDSGEVGESDYVWRPGMKEWKKLNAMPELILSRKAKTQFKEEPLKETHAADLKAPNVKAFDSFADMPVFIEPYSKREVEEPIVKPLRPNLRKVKLSGAPYLPSLLEEFNYKREVKIFLSFVAMFFFVGLSIGLLKPEIFTNFKSSTRALYSYFSPAYTASYLMIRPSVLDKKIIRFRSDAKKGASVSVSVRDLSGNSMSLIDTKSRAISLELDSAGVAEVNLNKFNLKPFKNYVVVAKMGGLEAKKSVIYVP
jgi:hypothetical protein